MNQSGTGTSQDAKSQDIPIRQIRARQPTPDTVIVYQAFSEEIAEAAVAQQRLDADEDFSANRMTWLKPSFFCCMYRAAWSYKGVHHARILQITMKRDGIISILREATPPTRPEGENSDRVFYDWNPERNVKLAGLEHKTLLLGISGDIASRWVNEWIVDIKDITEDVRRWKDILDNYGKGAARKVMREIAAKLGPEEVLEIGDEEVEKRIGMRGST